jgi:hypothetical protein
MPRGQGTLVIQKSDMYPEAATRRYRILEQDALSIPTTIDRRAELMIASATTA